MYLSPPPFFFPWVSLSFQPVIAVWSIIFCRCVGLISSEEVLAAHLASASADEDLTPREALELVKERIEGEAVTPTWCSVDTRIGGLTIHLEEGRCFDAEIHLDELGEELEGSFKEDQRGKFWTYRLLPDSGCYHLVVDHFSLFTSFNA